MKNYLTLGYELVVKALFRDNFNLILTTLSVFLIVLDYLIWNWRMESPDLYVVSIGTIFPVEYLAIIWVINTILAVVSYEKEKEIGYLLLSANVFASLLILILEIYYFVFSYA